MEPLATRITGPAGTSVGPVAHDRMIDRLHVDTNLMSASGLKCDRQKGHGL
jgi:hypothetical protein